MNAHTSHPCHILPTRCVKICLYILSLCLQWHVCMSALCATPLCVLVKENSTTVLTGAALSEVIKPFSDSVLPERGGDFWGHAWVNQMSVWWKGLADTPREVVSSCGSLASWGQGCVSGWGVSRLCSGLSGGGKPLECLARDRELLVWSKLKA